MVLPGVAPVSVPSIDDCSWSASPPSGGGRLHRNRWTACVGISGRNGSESLAALPRNTQPSLPAYLFRAICLLLIAPVTQHRRLNTQLSRHLRQWSPLDVS